MFWIRSPWMVGMALSITLAGISSSASAFELIEQSNNAPAAPIRVCEIRQKAWCMYQEDSEITDQPVTERRDAGNHIWSMRSMYHPDDVIMIIEPDGCRNNFANEVRSLGFDENVKWHGRTWDGMRIRLRTDGSCDLQLLVSPYDGNPLEWAFSVGRLLIAACPDDKCTSIVPTPGDVTDKYRGRFMRMDGRP